MKRAFIIITSVIVLAAAAYWGYYQWFQPKRIDIWELIPDKAVAVYSTQDPVRTWNNITTSTFWNNLALLPRWRSIQEQMVLLDSLSGKDGKLDRALRGKETLISLHVTGDDSFDFLFALTLENKEAAESLENIRGAIRQNADLHFSSRNYQGYEIFEIINRVSGSTFSYLIHGGHWIGSYSPFLVEDVIRVLEGEASSFRSGKSKLFSGPKLSNDEGDLYVNFGAVPDFLACFSSDDKNLQSIKDLAATTFLDLTVVEDNLILNGNSYGNPDLGQYLIETQKGQLPESPKFKRFVSNKTATLTHYAFSDAAQWYAGQQQYMKSTIKDDSVKKALDLDPSRFFEWIDKEVCFAVLESIDWRNPGKVLYLRADDIPEALLQFNRLSERIADSSGDSIYAETYADNTIGLLDTPEFPSLIFGNKYSGFEQTFYTPVGNYLLLSNDLTTLKTVISDIEQEDTWGKSVAQNVFLQNTLPEANINFYFNTARVWSLLLANLNPYWRTVFEEQSFALRRFERGAIQFHAVDGQYYTNIQLKSASGEVDQLGPKRLEVVARYQHDLPLASPPWVIRNPRNKSFEVILQDSALNVLHVDREGSFLWYDSVGENIQGDISTIDYFQNGRQQILFSTQRKLHIIDEVGKSVGSFPISYLPKNWMRQSEVVDYDNNKRYRFMVSDSVGAVWLFDKSGSSLMKWEPRLLSNNPHLSIGHLRVRGKDGLYAIDEEGVIHVMNRRAKMFQGFPLDLNVRLQGDVFIEAGAGFSKTFFHVISEDGQKIRFNLNGKLLKREQLYRPSQESKFRLIKDVLNSNYVIARQNRNRLSILDRQGEVIFEKDYLTSNQVEVQYYSFGSGREVYAVTDRLQEFTYLYDATGELINYQPLNSGYPVRVAYFENQEKYQVYTVYQDQMTIYSFSR